MGALEGNSPCSDNDWEAVKKGGGKALEKWIADQLVGRSCTVVLVGGETANRKWVRHEIVTSWNGNKGVVEIRIHNLLNSSGTSGVYGSNPFDLVTFSESGKKLSTVVKLYDPSGANSGAVYKTIKESIAGWVEEAITIPAAN